MIVLTAVLYPAGSPGEAREILHGTVTNVGTSGNNDSMVDSYAAHILQRPKKEIGIEGWEADVRVEGHNRRLGFASMLGSILYAIDPVPMEFEPQVDITARLTLRDMDEFDERLRGRK